MCDTQHKKSTSFLDQLEHLALVGKQLVELWYRSAFATSRHYNIRKRNMPAHTWKYVKTFKCQIETRFLLFKLIPSNRFLRYAAFWKKLVFVWMCGIMRLRSSAYPHPVMTCLVTLFWLLAISGKALIGYPQRQMARPGRQLFALLCLQQKQSLINDLQLSSWCFNCCLCW